MLKSKEVIWYMANFNREEFAATRNIIINKLDTALTKYVSLFRGSVSMNFTIPVAVYGRRKYDHQEMIEAVTKTIEDKGFSVSPGTSLGEIKISWDDMKTKSEKIIKKAERNEELKKKLLILKKRHAEKKKKKSETNARRWGDVNGVPTWE